MQNLLTVKIKLQIVKKQLESKEKQANEEFDKLEKQKSRIKYTTYYIK